MKPPILAFLVVIGSVLGLAAPTAAGSPPANDDFSAATVVGSLPYDSAQGVADATAAAGDPDFACGPLFSGQGYHTVWYRYAPDAPGKLIVDTFGSAYDTVLAVWTGSPGALTMQACNDDAAALGEQSQLDVEVAAGTPYYIEVVSFGFELSASLKLSISWLPDDFEGPLPIRSLPYSGELNTTPATVAAGDPSLSCGSSEDPRGTHTVWYQYVPAASGDVVVNTYGSAYDTVLAGWTGAPNAWMEGACNDDGASGASRQSEMVLPTTAGTDYHVEVAGYGPSGHGSLQLNVAWREVNDDFDGRRTVSSLPYTDIRNSSGATTAPDDPALSCGPRGVPEGFHTLWYAFRPVHPGTLTVDSAGSAYDTLLALWTGARGALTEQGCNDDVSNMFQSRIAAPVPPNVTHYIEITGYGDVDFGKLILAIDCRADVQTVNAVAAQWSRADLAWDCDGDQRISVADILCVAQRLDQSCS